MRQCWERAALYFLSECHFINLHLISIFSRRIYYFCLFSYILHQLRRNPWWAGLMSSHVRVFNPVEVCITCFHGDLLQLQYPGISHSAKHLLIYLCNIFMNLTEEATCQSGTTCVVTMTTCSSPLREVTHTPVT